MDSFAIQKSEKIFVIINNSLVILHVRIIHLPRFGSEEHISRLLEVHKDIEDTSRYHLTYDELVYGCGMAWRNAPRCVARVQWSTLKV